MSNALRRPRFIIGEMEVLSPYREDFHWLTLYGVGVKHVEKVRAADASEILLYLDTGDKFRMDPIPLRLVRKLDMTLGTVQELIGSAVYGALVEEAHEI